MYSPDLLKGQVAIVTGGSSGIGAAISQHLGRAGAAVVINYHSGGDSAKAIAQDLIDQGGQAIAVQADVSQVDQVNAMVAQTIETFGTVDILVNNAGIQKDAAFVDLTLEDWNRVINVNLTGQFICAQAVTDEFLRRGVRAEVSCAAGKIICMSSVHEVIPWAGHVNYAASKGGVKLFMESIAQELAPYRIRVNSIAPGAIKTPINQDAWETEDARRSLLKLIPFGRIGTPDDVAKAAVWLASDESDYVTGETLFIDGGMTLYPGFASGNG